MKRLLPALLSTSVACATLTSVLAMARLQEAATSKAALPQDVPAAKPVEARTSTVRIYKTAPRPKGAAAPVEKKAEAKLQVGKAVIKRAQPLAVRVNNQDGQVQQMMMQIRPVLRAEFHIIRVACRPTPEQRKAIAQAAEQTLRDVTKNYVESMRRPMTAAQRAANDPRRMIEEGLLQAIKPQLPAEQVARYQEELTKRAAGRKRLALRNLVARLDHDLVLSPEQRDKLSESLSANWDDAWGQSLEMYLYDNNFFPQISDQYVVPFLNESQKKVWKGAQRFQTFWGGFGIMGGVIDNDPLEDEELREARLAAAKKDANEPRNAPAMMEMMKAQIRVLEKVQRK